VKKKLDLSKIKDEAKDALFELRSKNLGSEVKFEEWLELGIATNIVLYRGSDIISYNKMNHNNHPGKKKFIHANDIFVAGPSEDIIRFEELAKAKLSRVVIPEKHVFWKAITEGKIKIIGELGLNVQVILDYQRQVVYLYSQQKDELSGIAEMVRSDRKTPKCHQVSKKFQIFVIQQTTKNL